MILSPQNISFAVARPMETPIIPMVDYTGISASPYRKGTYRTYYTYYTF
jgi:hypothetical protein